MPAASNSACGCSSNLMRGVLLTGLIAAPLLSSQLDVGLALVRAGKLREALVPLRQAATIPALATKANFLLGTDLFELHDPQAAIQILEPLRQSPHAERVLYMLEESYRGLGQATQAKSAFHELNTRFPDGPWMHLLMAAAYESQAQPEKAVDEYRAALAKDPAMPNVHFAVGYLFWRQGELEQARIWLQQETGITPCHSLAHFYLGEIARTSHDANQAETQYRKAISCDADYGEAHLRLGSVLSPGSHTAEALHQLQLAAQLLPTQSAPHYQMATLYRRLGQTAKADAEYAIVRTMKAKEGA